MGAVERVKPGKAAHCEGFSIFLEGLSPLIYAVGTKPSPATMQAALLLALDLQQAPTRQRTEARMEARVATLGKGKFKYAVKS